MGLSTIFFSLSICHFQYHSSRSFATINKKPCFSSRRPPPPNLKFEKATDLQDQKRLAPDLCLVVNTTSPLKITTQKQIQKYLFISSPATAFNCNISKKK